MGRRTAFLGIAGTSGGRLRSFPNGVQLEGPGLPPDPFGQRRAGRCHAAAASQSSVPAGRPVALRQPAQPTPGAVCGCHTGRGGARLLGDRKPFLLVTDPPYGIELDSEWRDRAGLNGCGPAEASYMKHRTEGHTETTISGDTRADW